MTSSYSHLAHMRGAWNMRVVTVPILVGPKWCLLMDDSGIVECVCLEMVDRMCMR